jgi:hypothetical protein
MDTFSKLHGTTVDRFQIGTKSQRITLTGTNSGADTISLLDRDGNAYTADATVFFTAYIIGTDAANAAYLIKGCYINGTSGVSGYVTDTFVNSNGNPNPTVSFNSSGVMTIACTGLVGQNMSWTATVDIVKI